MTTDLGVQWRHQQCGIGARALDSKFMDAHISCLIIIVRVQHQGISSTHIKEGQLEALHFLTARSLELIVNFNHVFNLYSL